MKLQHRFSWLVLLCLAAGLLLVGCAADQHPYYAHGYPYPYRGYYYYGGAYRHYDYDHDRYMGHHAEFGEHGFRSHEEHEEHAEIGRGR